MGKQFVSNSKDSTKMFKNDIAEALSKVHFTVPLILFLPVVSFFVYKSFFELSIPLLTFALYFGAGILAWTLLEYIVHRFIFHYEPKSEFGKRLHFIVHGVHHDYPNDAMRLVMVPTVSIPLAILFYALFYITMGEYLTAPFYSGFVLGYLIYDMMHYALHHLTFNNKFWLTLKKNHMVHHYKDSERGFGVSSSLWDLVFQTKIKDGSKN